MIPDKTQQWPARRSFFAKVVAHIVAKRLYVVAASAILLIYSVNVGADNVKPPRNNQHLEQGMLLVATTNLHHSSFRKTVIFLTHYGMGGASGLAINRSSSILLNKAFPKIKEFSDAEQELFLGGPVHPNAVFVLTQTKQPQTGMQKIAKNIYFSSGIDAMQQKYTATANSSTAMAFAGYTGWSPGQLKSEIDRGDWLVIKADPNIIFSNNYKSLWESLHRSWSGDWI